MLSRFAIQRGRQTIFRRPAMLGLACGSVGLTVVVATHHDNEERFKWLNKNHITWTEGNDDNAALAESSINAKKSSSNLPTLEATIRGMRLVQTALLMIVDYERAKLERRFHLPLAAGKVVNKDLDYWEHERDERRKELRNAQTIYSTSDTPEQQQTETPEQRRQRKQQQKQVMLDVASRLGDAEEELAELGGDRQSQVHTKAANRLLRLCRTNGGAYIKVGQHLANLDYLIPTEYITTLSSLFDDTPLTSYDNVCRVVKEELGGNPDELFDHFSPTPIASASLAQVHVAYEKGTGRKLAVKVQHFGLRDTFNRDLTTLVAVVRAVEVMFPSFPYGWIVDELAPQLPQELNFTLEANNAERAATYLAKTNLNCIVPKVIWPHTTNRVLTMEFEEGFKATDINAIERAGLNKRDVARLVSSVFSSQVFGSGFCHCDPHPANVLLRRGTNGKPQMILIDHGLYKALDHDFRINYAHLYQSLMMADVEGIKDACAKLGIDRQRSYILLSAMLTARPFDEILERSKRKSLSNPPEVQPHSRKDRAIIQGYAQGHFAEIFNLLGSLPRQMLLLLKMNDCLRHIDYALGSPTNTLIVAGKYAAQAVLQDEMQRNDSNWWTRLRAYWNYFGIMARIRIHDLGVWWLMQHQKLTIQM